MANILHRAGVPNDALVVTNMALEISPKFVVIHFTMANIYVTKARIRETLYRDKVSFLMFGVAPPLLAERP